MGAALNPSQLKMSPLSDPLVPCAQIDALLYPSAEA